MRKKYDWFSLTFRNISSGESRDVRFIVEPGVLAQKWAGLLQRLLQSETILRKNNVLSSWATTPRDLNYLCSELNRHISLINKFYANKPKDFHYHIRWHFEPGTVDQKLLNLIHHDFEVITGPTWNISRRYKMAPRDIRFSVQQLNNLCHEIEALLWAQKADKEGYLHGAVVASIFPKKRLRLSREERSGSQVLFNFGDVRLHYGQMGKTHFDAFCCNDDVIDDKSVTELRYLTGEFDISFSADVSAEEKESQLKAFHQWLHEKGVDPDENFGFPVVAKLDRSQFSSEHPADILKTLFNFDDICRISLNQDGKVYFRDFPHLWNDPLMTQPPPVVWKELLRPSVLWDELRLLVTSLRS